MRFSRNGLGMVLLGALAALVAAPTPAAAASPKPVAGKEVRFPNGTWSALPQTGPDGKVRQCVLVAPRSRAGKDGPIQTRFTMTIGRGAGFAVGIADDTTSSEAMLDDQAELVIDGKSFPADAFSVGTTLAFHPGDAAGALAALNGARQLMLRSDGAGVDTGAITLQLPPDALNWLKQCGREFNIATDRPTDPDAPELPTPRPPSPKILITQPTAAGPPGIEDKQKFNGWDASELRDRDGAIIVCFIRRHYFTGKQSARTIATFLMVSRLRGLTMMLKDSDLNLPQGQPVEATLTIGDKPFTAFTAHMLGTDEIGIFPEHGLQLAAAIEADGHLNFKSKAEGMEFPVQGGVIGWLRACSRRNGIPFEPAGP